MTGTTPRLAGADRSGAGRHPEDPTPPHESPTRSGRRRRRRWPVLVALLLLLAAWSVAVALLLMAARGDLTAARDASERAVDALGGADVRAAQEEFAAAERAFLRATGRMRNPLVGAAAVLPVVGGDLRTVTALSEAGVLVARAGEGVTRAALELPGGPGSLAPTAGNLPVDAVAALGPSVTVAADLVEQARVLIAGTPEQARFAPVGEARAAFAEQVDRAAATVAVAEPLVRVLPGFLGAEQPRRYFFAAAQPAELRGVNGFMGAYAILTVDQGRFAFSSFSPIQDLPDQPPDAVEPPHPDFAARYAAFGGAGVWRNLNLSPDFPTTGMAIERLWEVTHGERLDGVISADPFALAALLEVSGPAEVPGLGMLDADRVVPFVANEAYAVLTDPEERKRLLGAVAAAALSGFLAEGVPRGEGKADAAQALAALRALGSAARDGHLLVYAADPQVQEAFERAGVAGGLLDPPGDYFAAILNSASGSKVDFYLQRDLDYRVTLLPDGRAEAEAVLGLTNGAPTEGQPSYVIGPNVDRVQAGDTELYVNAYLPSAAALTGFSVDGSPGRGRIGSELGHPVVETFELLPSGTRREFSYRSDHPAAWEPDGEGGTYRLTIQEQAAIQATRAGIEIRLPEGVEVVRADERLTVDGATVRYSGEIRGTFVVEVAFAPTTPAASLVQRVGDWLVEPVVRLGG